MSGKYHAFPIKVGGIMTGQNGDETNALFEAQHFNQGHRHFCRSITRMHMRDRLRFDSNQPVVEEYGVNVVKVAQIESGKRPKLTLGSNFGKRTFAKTFN
jgi:hypothetical protein